MATKGDSRWSQIERELELTRGIAGDTHVSMVLNEPAQSGVAVDYDWHSITTEYLDDSEKSELMTGLRDAGFAATIYDGEKDFLGAVLNGDWKRKTFLNKYVFNTTGSGIGRARTSLIPSFCDLFRIPLCSADGLTAALLENKFYTFRLLAALGFMVPQSSLYVTKLGWNGAPPSIGKKVICKPCRECSSIGIDERSIFVYEPEKMTDIEKMARTFQQPILVQEFIAGYEVEVPVFPCPQPVSPAAIGIMIKDQEHLGDAVLENRNIIAGDYGFYNFDAFDNQIAEKLKSTAEAAYQALCFSGFARVDWRITPNGDAYITDVNTPPHLTHHSSCNLVFELGGYQHADLMASLVTVGRLNAAP